MHDLRRWLIAWKLHYSPYIAAGGKFRLQRERLDHDDDNNYIRYPSKQLILFCERVLNGGFDEFDMV